MKGQSAIEYLILFGFLLAAITLLANYVNYQSGIETSSQQAQVAVNTLSEAADNIYAQGPGAKTTINVYFPNRYVPDQSSLSGNRILLKVRSGSGYSDFVAITKGPITGGLPKSAGYKVITMLLVNGIVVVSSS